MKRLLIVIMAVLTLLSGTLGCMSASPQTPAPEPSPTPNQTPAMTPSPAPIYIPVLIPASKPEPVPEPESAPESPSEPESVSEPEPTPEPVSEPEPEPVPEPAPVPVPVQPQRFEVQLPRGSAVGASYAISRLLEEGEAISGFVEIYDPESHSTEYSRNWYLKVFTADGKEVYSWKGYYDDSNNNEFSFAVTYSDRYIIKVTHHSSYPKYLFIKISPPGWTKEKV